MKCSLGISNFLEEISSFFLFYYFLYFFALITEEGFLFSPCYSLELCIQMLISFLFSFAFHFSSLIIKEMQIKTIVGYLLTSPRMAVIKRQEITSVSKDVE